jgi:hypothetical protein
MKQKIAARREEILAALGQGVATWDLYNQMVGQLLGLGEAVLLSDDADHELTGG